MPGMLKIIPFCPLKEYVYNLGFIFDPTTKRKCPAENENSLCQEGNPGQIVGIPLQKRRKFFQSGSIEDSLLEKCPGSPMFGSTP